VTSDLPRTLQGENGVAGQYSLADVAAKPSSPPTCCSLAAQGVAPASEIIERQPGGRGTVSLRRLYRHLVRIVVGSHFIIGRLDGVTESAQIPSSAPTFVRRHGFPSFEDRSAIKSHWKEKAVCVDTAWTVRATPRCNGEKASKARAISERNRRSGQAQARRDGASEHGRAAIGIGDLPMAAQSAPAGPISSIFWLLDLIARLHDMRPPCRVTQPAKRVRSAVDLTA